VPLPDSLVSLLKKAHKNKKHDRWIFVNGDGKPRDHSLRRLKQIALDVGFKLRPLQDHDKRRPV